MKTLISSILVLLSCSALAAPGGRDVVGVGHGSSGILIEPSIGYSSGVLKQLDVADISTQVMNIEGRFGYRFSEFATGLSFLMGFGTGKQYSVSGDVKPTDLAVFASYELFMNISLFGAYIFNSKMKLQSAENPQDFTGQGSRIGVAWSGWSMASVMLDLTSRKYAKYGGASMTQSIQDSSTSVSLSFPF